MTSPGMVEQEHGYIQEGGRDKNESKHSVLWVCGVPHDHYQLMEPVPKCLWLLLMDQLADDTSTPSAALPIPP